ncbi:MAG: HDOD domain-containing protein [Burkholderiales bacterium]|uniref:HDOD domain-containing protein n=1 Tax=Janthinobacterium tructae TaxID=2590869 RepID=A0A4Y6R951_9BURK|nr:HDOD domain-containing protein [Janthinobacterium tructae]MBH1984756.1 HDOD domain-containing protein [Burkholderiales bacterium]MBH1996946.1 HDOD domain-containing protein [Burkholderiales bacterium]MBH2069805.1 HDOD domain-containing protein [Burkholderiales bacterium]QDG69114.1 HDOD domain-containing protein [Janthinobacterium tructae]
MGWIGKLLNGGDEKNKPAPVTAAAAPEATLQPATITEIDAMYYRWLAAAGSAQAPAETEQKILDELARLVREPIAGAALVPRIPAIIPQLMRTLQDENMSAAKLSAQLAQDVLLVAEVYREANRPCYQSRYNASPSINNMEGAIMLLGQNGMRMLLARVAFRPIVSMQSGGLTVRTAPLIWRQSEKCALAASLVAPTMHANAFDAYLAGLMANVGLVVAFRLIDQMHGPDAFPQSDAFIAQVFAQARILSVRIAELWEFPQSVTRAIGQAGVDANADPQAQALALGERLSKLRMLADSGRFPADDPFVTTGLGKSELLAFGKLADDDE